MERERRKQKKKNTNTAKVFLKLILLPGIFGFLTLPLAFGRYRGIEEMFLWRFFCALTASLLFFYLLKKVLKKAHYRNEPIIKTNIITLFKWGTHNLTIIKKIIISIVISAGFAALGYLSLPGVDRVMYRTYHDSFFQSSIGKMLSSMMKSVSINQLGIAPFLFACTFLQVFSLIIPPLRKKMFSGEKGLLAIRKYTYWLTCIISLAGSFLLCNSILPVGGNHDFVVIPDRLFIALGMCVITLTVFAGLILALLINKYGIGNGYAWVLLSGMLFRIVPFVKGIRKTVDGVLKILSPGSLALILLFIA